jgi:hypothetical protein
VYGNEDAISLFCGIFEIAQICTDLLEIRIDKKYKSNERGR